jgi:hypothetical protein
MKHYLLGIQLFFFGSLVCMEQWSDSALSKELLHAKYCSLKIEELIKFADIKPDAMSLLNKDLDDYYEQRLLAQPLPQPIEENKVEKYILMKLCPEFNPLFNAVQHHIITDNVRNKHVKQEKACSYGPEIDGAGPVKKFPTGHFKFMPTIQGLSADLFNGTSDKSGFMHQEELYVLYAHAMSPAKRVYALTSSKIQDNRISDKSEMNVWTMNPNVFVKKIQHIYAIENALLSPDAQWIASNSPSGSNGKLMLTHLGDNDPYLSETELILGFNATSSIYFNNSSTVLATDHFGDVVLFDLKTKECIARLRPLDLYFDVLDLMRN